MRIASIALALLFALGIILSATQATDPWELASGSYDGLTKKEILDLETEREASKLIDQQVSRGTYPTIYVQATAYTWTGRQTATGSWPAVGTVSVDPTVIPLGTRLRIEGYGEGIALDTGSAIKGKKIDVYFDSKAECIQWGNRHQVEVRILNTEEILSAQGKIRAGAKVVDRRQLVSIVRKEGKSNAY